MVEDMSKPIQFVNQRELRDLFNHHILPDMLAGRLRTVTVADKHPSSNKGNEPYCTRSQFIDVLSSDGERIAGAHQYLRVDGTLGASGRPDPKIVVIEGVVYRAVDPEKR